MIFLLLVLLIVGGFAPTYGQALMEQTVSRDSTRLDTDPLLELNQELAKALLEGDYALAALRYDSLQAEAHSQRLVALDPITEYCCLALLGKWKALSDSASNRNSFPIHRYPYQPVGYIGRYPRYFFHMLRSKKNISSTKKSPTDSVAKNLLMLNSTAIRQRLHKDMPDNYDELDRLVYVVASKPPLYCSHCKPEQRCPYPAINGCQPTVEYDQKDRQTYKPHGPKSFPFLERYYRYPVSKNCPGFALLVGPDMQMHLRTAVNPALRYAYGASIGMAYLGRKGGYGGLRITNYGARSIQEMTVPAGLAPKGSGWRGSEFIVQYGHILYGNDLRKSGVILGLGSMRYTQTDSISNGNGPPRFANNWFEGASLSLSLFHDIPFWMNQGRSRQYQEWQNPVLYLDMALRISPQIGIAALSTPDHSAPRIGYFWGLTTQLLLEWRFER